MCCYCSIHFLGCTYTKQSVSTNIRTHRVFFTILYAFLSVKKSYKAGVLECIFSIIKLIKGLTLRLSATDMALIISKLLAVCVLLHKSVFIESVSKTELLLLRVDDSLILCVL